jgi:hypothetical protein
MQVLDNTIVTVNTTNEWQVGGGKFLDIVPPTTGARTTILDRNTYRGGVEKSDDYYNRSRADYKQYQPFRYNDYTNELSWNRWTNVYGYDLNSSYSTNLPVENVVAIRTNKYEPGRSHLIVFNWRANTEVTVDLSTTGIVDGRSFEVRDAQNFFGPAVYSGKYRSNSPSVTLPLLRSNLPSLFNLFVVLPTQRILAAPPTELRADEL